MIKRAIVQTLLFIFVAQPLLVSASMQAMPMDHSLMVHTMASQSDAVDDIACHDDVNVGNPESEKLNLNSLVKVEMAVSFELVDSEISLKHDRCKKSCHCCLGLITAVLFEGLESFPPLTPPSFFEDYPSTSPIKISPSLQRPPILA